MITKEEVKHIAKLARLGLTEKEIETYQKELSSIFDYIEKLKIELPEEASQRDESLLHPSLRLGQMKKKTKSSSPKVDISKIEPTSHSIRVENIEREDKESERQEARSKKLMDLAPETKQGFLKVKSIFK